VGQKLNSLDEFKEKTCWTGTVFKMEEEKYGIPLFDGNNYPDWKFRMTKRSCGSLPREPPTGYPNRYRSNNLTNRIIVVSNFPARPLFTLTPTDLQKDSTRR
jgi:hypothetical protein